MEHFDRIRNENPEIVYTDNADGKQTFDHKYYFQLDYWYGAHVDIRLKQIHAVDDIKDAEYYMYLSCDTGDSSDWTLMMLFVDCCMNYIRDNHAKLYPTQEPLAPTTRQTGL